MQEKKKAMIGFRNKLKFVAEYSGPGVPNPLYRKARPVVKGDIKPLKGKLIICQ